MAPPARSLGPPSAPATRPEGEGTWQRRERWLYLANARVPSEKAHVYQIFQMLQALQQAGVEVELVYPTRANVGGLGEHDPVAFYGLRSRPALRRLASLDPVRLVTIDVPALNRPPLPAAAFAVQSGSFALAAAFYARRSRADVLYSRDWPVLAAVVAARPAAPAIWEAHDVPQGRPARAALGWLLPRLAGVVAISHGVRDALARLGVPPERMLVAPDAVDPARFAVLPGKAEARARLNLPLDRPIVVYAGQLYPWKGAHTLALASRSLPDGVVVCIVGGTVADLRGFGAFVRANGLDRVRLPGYVPPGEVPLWLAAADALALPNSGREVISARYTSPLKLYEYMAAARPIVASDLPSLREVLRHGHNAYLVAPDDPVALAEGLRALLAAPDLAARLAGQARDEVEGHTWAARARGIVEFVRHRVAADGCVI